MNDIRFALTSDASFNSLAFDRLVSGIARRAPALDRDLVIDLGQARFIDPYGMVCLVMLARYLEGPQRSVAYVLPADEQTQEFMQRMGLYAYLARHGQLRNVSRSRAATRSGQHGLALTTLTAGTDVLTIVSHFLGLARSELGFEPGDLADSAKIVSELSHNVKDHSGDEGLAAAHLYRDREGRRFVTIGVADLGVGIRASLAGAHTEVAAWTHQQALEQALNGLSSRPAGGGLGLTSVQGIVRRYRGTLSLRSGDAKLQIAAGRTPRALRVAQFPGTQVGISFSQRSGEAGRR